MIRLKVSAAGEAATLAEELVGHGAAVEREGEILTTVWPASDADHVDLWEEHDFPELVFFLRAWAGENADRQVVVLEERPLGL